MTAAACVEWDEGICEEEPMPRSGRPKAVAEIPLIEMIQPMPGFPAARGFALVRLDDAGVLCALRSVDEPGLRFLVVPPDMFFADYAPEIDDKIVAALGIESPNDVLVLVVVNPGGGAEEATANLLAPVLVNVAKRRACQVILTADLPVRARLVA